MNKATIKHAFISSLPVMAGYIVLGIGFGVLLTTKGYPIYLAFLMSLFIYAGSMQFVGINLITSGATIIATILMTIMVNARHLFYGISMIKEYKEMGWRKPYLIFALTDETYSLVCGHPNLEDTINRKNYYFLLSLMNQSYWVIGSTLGAVLGSTITFNSAGIDFAMTALFITIVIDQWEKNKQHIPALLGLSVSIVCLIIFGSSDFLIPSMIIITFGLFLFRKKIEGDPSE